MTTCNNVEYDYGQNQGVFKDVSQCTNNVSVPFVAHDLSQNRSSLSKRLQKFMSICQQSVYAIYL